jgi:hypothetical protein
MKSCCQTFFVLVCLAVLVEETRAGTRAASDEDSYKRARSALLTQRAATEQLQSKIALEKSVQDEQQVKHLMKKARDIVAKIAALQTRAAAEQTAKLTALREAKAARAAEQAAKEQQLRQEQEVQERAKAASWANEDVQKFLAEDEGSSKSANSNEQKAWRAMKSVVSDDLSGMLQRDERDAANAGIVKMSAMKRGEDDVKEDARQEHLDAETNLISAVSNFFLSAEHEALQAVSNIKASSPAVAGPPGPPGPPGAPGKAIRLPEDAAVPIIVHG